MSKNYTLEEIQERREKIKRKQQYYENEKKRLEHEIKTLTRKERTHRLCTRGGTLEGFLGRPGEISDEQVYDLLKIAFRQDEVKSALSSILQSIPEVDFVEEPGLPYGSP